MLAYLSLTATTEATAFAGTTRVKKMIEQEGLPHWCYSAERDAGGEIVLQCNCCGKPATEEHLQSKTHKEMMLQVSRPWLGPVNDLRHRGPLWLGLLVQ